MYGKEKGAAGAVFDLERDLTGPQKAAKLAELKKLISSRQEEMKKALREGEDKEVFAFCESQLHGYNALQQVTERIAR